MENTEIIPLAISDREYLLKKVNQISKNQKIACVIGVYNPELYGIPYIPISKLFDTPPDKLDILLSLETAQSVMSVNYDAIYAYLKEQLEGFDIQLLKRSVAKGDYSYKESSAWIVIRSGDWSFYAYCMLDL